MTSVTISTYRLFASLLSSKYIETETSRAFAQSLHALRDKEVLAFHLLKPN